MKEYVHVVRMREDKYPFKKIQKKYESLELTGNTVDWRWCHVR